MNATALRVVKPGELPVSNPPNPTDAEIRRIEDMLAKQAEHEAYFWGGPRGEGVIPGLKHLGEQTAANLKQLGDTVGQLATAVATLTSRVTGEDGLAIRLRDVSAKLDLMEARHSLELEDAKQQREQDAKDSKARIDRLWQVGLAIGIPTLTLLLGLATRSLYVWQHGVVVAH